MAESSLKAGRPVPDGDRGSRASEARRTDLRERPSAGPIPLGPAEPGVPERYQVGDLRVDVGAGVVTRGETRLTLSPLTFDLLVALIRHAPNVMRRQELLAKVWPDEFVNDDTLSQRARSLRDALGDLAKEPRYLASVHGWGYKLVADVERLKNQPGPIRALAVLPLANLSGDPQQEYFADGMTEALISSLAKIHSLKIISRTSVMQYKHSEKRLPQIACELAVDAVVEGTVLAVGSRVRVSVQLIRAETDEHLWAETYDREIADVFLLHSDVAKSIAGEIRAVLTPEEQRRLEPRGRVNPAAHESHLRARYFLFKLTPPALEQAIGYFEQAIALDPSFGQAYAGLAGACFGRGVPLGSDLSVFHQRQLLDKAGRAAKRALDIDDSLAEAHAILGTTLLFYDWHGAQIALNRALELDSNSWIGHMYRGVLASTLLDAGRTLAEMRRALELDPLNLLCRAEAAECCFWVRDYAEALAYASQVLELDPAFPRAHFILGRVREAEGRIAEAINEYERAGVIKTAEAARRAFLERGAAGYHRWALRAGITADPHNAAGLRDRPFFRARIHTRLGEVDQAIECLEQAFQQRDCLLALLKAQEWWDPLRSDPRFADLVRRVGIP